MKNITLNIECKPLTVNFDGQEIEVQELSIRLPFGRKPSDINDIAGSRCAQVQGKNRHVHFVSSFLLGDGFDTFHG